MKIFIFRIGDPELDFDPISKKTSAGAVVANREVASVQRVIKKYSGTQRHNIRRSAARYGSDDEKYARVFIDPLRMSQKYAEMGRMVSSLEIAFRSISWLWALQFSKISGVVPESSHKN